MTGIGTLNESPLHAALKQWCLEDGDTIETPVDGFVVDIVRGGTLIEIQTRGFSAMRRKFDRLLDGHPMVLIHPIPVTRWIIKLDGAGEAVSRRRSPKRGVAADVCAELVSFPSLLSHPNFTVQVVLTEEEEVWRPDRGRGRRRKGFAVQERRLIEVVDTITIGSPEALLAVLPAGLPEIFTTADLAGALKRSRHLAQEVAYCLRESEAVEVVGRDKRGILYRHPRG